MPFFSKHYSDIAAAALVMYQRAIKLQEIITNVQLFLSFGEEQLDSYSIAINALILVDEHSQWVILPVVGESVSEISLC